MELHVVFHGKYSDDFMILVCVVLKRHSSVTYGHKRRTNKCLYDRGERVYRIPLAVG